MKALLLLNFLYTKKYHGKEQEEPAESYKTVVLFVLFVSVSHKYIHMHYTLPRHCLSTSNVFAMNTAQNVGTSNALILMILFYSFVSPVGDSFL